MRIVFKTTIGAVALASAIVAPAVRAAPSRPVDLAAVTTGGAARAPLILPRFEADSPDGDADLASAFRPSAPARSPTAVDYSLARGGPHGSLGYICLDGLAPIAPREAAVTAGTDGGRLIGGSFLIPIP